MYLTVHQLTALPLHNLNRDESGAPKTVTEGGVLRARLSSQSIKRAARVEFERWLERNGRQGASTRSREHTESVLADAIALIEASGKKVTDRIVTETRAQIERRLGLLTASEKPAKSQAAGAKKSDEAASDARATVAWLSAGERAALAAAVAHQMSGKAAETPFLSDATDSLAIAAFGRMFAAAPEFTQEAAVALSHATTTHAATIDLDFFTTVDDLTAGQGAAHMGHQLFTSGVYYRSTVIDTAQLRRNFSGTLDADEVAALVRQLIVALPNGRRAGTGAMPLPALVVVEEQATPVAYSFHTPVQASDDGGYLTGSVQSLLDQQRAAREFDPTLFGDSYSTADGTPGGAVDFIVKRVLA